MKGLHWHLLRPHLKWKLDAARVDVTLVEFLAKIPNQGDWAGLTRFPGGSWIPWGLFYMELPEPRGSPLGTFLSQWSPSRQCQHSVTEASPSPMWMNRQRNRNCFITKMLFLVMCLSWKNNQKQLPSHSPLNGIFQASMKQKYLGNRSQIGAGVRGGS